MSGSDAQLLVGHCELGETRVSWEEENAYYVCGGPMGCILKEYHPGPCVFEVSSSRRRRPVLAPAAVSAVASQLAPAESKASRKRGKVEAAGASRSAKKRPPPATRKALAAAAPAAPMDDDDVEDEKDDEEGEAAAGMAVKLHAQPSCEVCEESPTQCSSTNEPSPDDDEVAGMADEPCNEAAENEKVEAEEEKVKADDEEDDEEDLAAVVNWAAMMTTEAAEVAAAAAAADGRPAATYSAACWLLRLREACMHQPTLYHEVVQALHLRRSRQLSTEGATARVIKLLATSPGLSPLQRELSDTWLTLEWDAPIVRAALRLHGSEPLTLDAIAAWLRHEPPSAAPSRVALDAILAGATADESAALGAWPAWARELLADQGRAYGGEEGGEEGREEGREETEEAAAGAAEATRAAVARTTSRYGGELIRLRAPPPSTALLSSYTLAPARAPSTHVPAPAATVADDGATADGGGADGSGVVIGGSGWRTRPVPVIDVHAIGPSARTPLLKLLYRSIERWSYLDWGLTSDYDASLDEAGARGARAGGSGGGGSGGGVGSGGTGPLQWNGLKVTPTVHHAAGIPEERKEEVPYGLGGNTRGSEGYGELTQGSVAKLCILLANMRSSVLERLRPGAPWCASFDLVGEGTSLVDVGSGYGKVVAHVALENHVRCVGIECVISRHEIAEHALQEAKVELLLSPDNHLGAASPPKGGKSAAGGASSRRRGSKGIGKGRPKAATEVRAIDDAEEPPRATCGATEEPPSEALGEEPPSEALGEEPPSEALGAAAAQEDVVDASEEEMPISASMPAPGPPPLDTVSSHELATSRDSPLSLIEFHFGDSTVGHDLNFTHVYCFDRVFSPTTLRALALLLRRSPFRIFVSYRSPSEWAEHGLDSVYPVAKLRVKTTGHESYSPIVYANLRFAPR